MNELSRIDCTGLCKVPSEWHSCRSIGVCKILNDAESGRKLDFIGFSPAFVIFCVNRTAYFIHLCNTPVSVVRKRKNITFAVSIGIDRLASHIVKVFFASP